MDKAEDFSRTFITLLENSTDFLYFKDCNHRFTAVSSAFANLTGYSHWNEMIGKCDEEVFPKQYAEIYYKSDLSVMKTGIPIKNRREPYQPPEGDLGWVDTHKWPIIDDKGKTIGLFGISRDITQLVKAEEMLKKQEKDLKEAVNTKDKFFSIIAHDLRSPFNTILGFTELVIKKTKKIEATEYEKYFGFINSSAKKTLVLLDNLLNWAKSETGKISFNPEKQIFSSVVYEIFQLLNTNAENKNIILNFFESEEIIVFADPNMIRSILRNLISNAIKFTNQNGKIDVHALQHNKFVEIVVSDNGVGMDEKTQNKLFRPNSNLSTLGTANEKGTGLGLKLCKEFVEKHRGKIWVESAVGKGTIFKFTIPLEQY